MRFARLRNWLRSLDHLCAPHVSGSTIALFISLVDPVPITGLSSGITVRAGFGFYFPLYENRVSAV